MPSPSTLPSGSGTRLWSLSRAALPKQFLPLISEHTLFQETLLCLKNFSDIAAPITFLCVIKLTDSVNIYGQLLEVPFKLSVRQAGVEGA